MRLKHVLLVCLAIAFVISQVGIVPASASGNLYKISVVDGNVTLGELSTYGVSIEETYDNFVIGSIDPSQVQTLRDNGFDALEFEPNRNVYINGYTLTADENMILTPTPTTPLDLTFYEVDLNKSNFFILQFGYPVKQEWQDTITQSGAKIVGALSDGALIIKALPQVISSFKQMDRVTGGNVFHPAFKISNDITPDEDGNTKVTVMLHPGERISYIINFIPGESFDGSIDLEDGSFNLECGFEDINQIAWITSVSNISPYIEPELDMDRSREIMGIEARSEDSSPSLDPLPQGIWDMGLRGQGKVVAVQDSGCDTGNLATLNEDYGLPPRIKAHFGYSRYGAGPYFPQDQIQTSQSRGMIGTVTVHSHRVKLLAMDTTPTVSTQAFVPNRSLSSRRVLAGSIQDFRTPIITAPEFTATHGAQIRTHTPHPVNILTSLSGTIPTWLLQYQLATAVHGAAIHSAHQVLPRIIFALALAETTDLQQSLFRQAILGTSYSTWTTTLGLAQAQQTQEESVSRATFQARMNSVSACRYLVETASDFTHLSNTHMTSATEFILSTPRQWPDSHQRDQPLTRESIQTLLRPAETSWVSTIGATIHRMTMFRTQAHRCLVQTSLVPQFSPSNG